MSPDNEPVVSVYWPTTAQKLADAQDASKKFTLGFAPGAAPDMSLAGTGACPGALAAGPVAPSCQLTTATWGAARRTGAVEAQPGAAKAIRRPLRQPSAAARRARHRAPRLWMSIKSDIYGYSKASVRVLSGRMVRDTLIGQ
jgi:hypothetical protein